MSFLDRLEDWLGDSGAAADRELARIQRAQRLSESRLQAFQAEQAEQIARQTAPDALRVATAQAQAQADRAAIDARFDVAEAQVERRRQLSHTLRTEAEEHLEGEYHLAVLTAVRSLTPEAAVARLERELAVERALLPYRFAQQTRTALPSLQQSTDLATAARAIAGAMPTSPAAITPRPESEDAAALTPYFSPQDIEQISLRALAQFGSLPAGRSDSAFQEFEAECQNRLPRATAQAVIERTRTLRGIAAVEE